MPIYCALSLFWLEDILNLLTTVSVVPVVLQCHAIYFCILNLATFLRPFAATCTYGIFSFPTTLGTLCKASIHASLFFFFFFLPFFPSENVITTTGSLDISAKGKTANCRLVSDFPFLHSQFCSHYPPVLISESGHQRL